MPLRVFNFVVCLTYIAYCSASVDAAVRVLDAEPIGDFNISAGQLISFDLPWSDLQNVSGMGLVADWTAVVADNSDGTNPWSLDLRATMTAPGASSLTWDPIGGDVTIADYPLADYSGTFASPQSGGIYSVEFTTPGVPSPYVSGLRDATVYATEVVDDVISEHDGSVASGPMWERPFFIEGVSGLGPVVYDVIAFSVEQSGGYSFESVIPSGNNFNFLYQGEFDASLPLENLLDYGLGNGFGANGTPQGTSLIESLLVTGETYYYVTSQFQRSVPGGSFETTIVGPGPIVSSLPGDFNGDGDYACDDVDSLVAAIVAMTHESNFDLTDDLLVDQNDLNAWLAIAGNYENDSMGPYLPGDADLNGAVDGADFEIWSQHKFTSSAAWCDGDFDADGVVSGRDFLIWNQNKSTFSIAIPESGQYAMWVWILAGIGVRRRRSCEMKDTSIRKSNSTRTGESAGQHLCVQLSKSGVSCR